MNRFLSGNLIKQGELVGSHSDSITVTGGNHNHSFSGNTSENGYHSHYFQVNNTQNRPGGYTTAYDSGTKSFDQYTSSSGSHTHSFSGETNYSGNLSMTGNVSHETIENRPSNYTMRIWKRIS